MSTLNPLDLLQHIDPVIEDLKTAVHTLTCQISYEEHLGYPEYAIEESVATLVKLQQMVEDLTWYSQNLRAAHLGLLRVNLE